MTGIIETIRSKLEADSNDLSSKRVFWNSVAVLDGDGYDEPMVLQQRYVPNRGRDIMYPSGTHRAVPLSDVDVDGLDGPGDGR